MENNIEVMQNEYVRASKPRADLGALFSAVPGTVRLTCLFGAFVFLQFTVLALANHAGEGYLTTGQRELVYYALQVFVISGYLLHALFFRFCAEKRVRRVISYAVFGIFFVCVTMMLAAGTDSLLNVIVSMTAAACLGGIGGAAHCRMSLETVRRTDVARCMGVGSAIAVVLQYLLQIMTGVTPLLPVFMAAAFLLCVFLLPGRSPEEAGGGRDHRAAAGRDYKAAVGRDHKAAACEGGNRGEVSSRRIALSILIAAAFILFTCFYNETIHHLMIRSGYASANVYSWPRLMLVPGYLLFAFIGDRKNGKYVPAVSLCIMLIALLNVVLTGYQSAWWFNMCLFYFSIAAFTSYYILTFWRLAPRTKHPALWAPFGRMLDSAMVLFTGAIHLSALPAPVVLGVDIAGVALVILMMAAGGDFNLAAASSDAAPGLTEGYGAEVPDTQDVQPPLSIEETFMAIQEDYHLTPRETDVLRELILTEDKQTVISERLSIRVKTLQDYVTRIYRKTGVNTRAGLINLYHEKRNQN